MRPWMQAILIDLAEVAQPEWCEICADFDVNQVPERATTSRDGVNCCRDCAASWNASVVDFVRVDDVTAPTVVQSFETMAAIVAGALS